MSGVDDESRVVDDIANLDSLWNFDDPAASEAKFRLLLERAVSANLTQDDCDLVRTQLARSLSLQQRFEEAHLVIDEIDRSRHSSPRLEARPPLLAVRSLLERGRTLNSSGRRGEAATLFLLAFERARARGLDAFAIDAAHMLAIAADASDQSLHWNERALALARSSTDPGARAWRASLLNNLGWTWHGRGDHEQALRHFQSALECRREQGDFRHIAVARWCVARCLRSLGRLSEALAIQRELLAEHAERGTPEIADGFVHEEIGECLLLLARPGEAKPHFLRAHELLARDQYLPQREPGRMERLGRLAGGGP